MEDLALVAVLESQQNLEHDLFYFVEVKNFVGEKYLFYIFFFELKYQVQSDSLFFFDDYLFELDDIGVFKVAEEHDLTKDSGGFVDVGKEAFDFFDRDDFVGFDVASFHDN